MTRRGPLGAATGLVIGLLVLAPVLGRGVVLSYDMVFVPDPPITGSVLGTDGSVPRAVPTELLADLLAHILPVVLVQDGLLLAAFVLAGAGAARLAPTLPGAAAAAIAYVWTPYVAERLVIGHWTFLLGYALLPWVVSAALGARRGDSIRPLLLWLAAAAAAGSTSALIATGTAVLVIGLRPGGIGRLAGVVGFAVAVNLPWLVPALVRPGGLPADPAGVAAFAARSDTPLGLAGSLLTLGGIWNPATVPDGRDSPLALVALVAVLAALGLGVRRVWDESAGLVVAGLVGLVLAAAGAVPGLDAVLRLVVVHVPGGGLLRDGQKLLAPTALVVAVAAGYAVARLAAIRTTVPYAVLLGVLPVLALPTLVWGVGGRLAAAEYPADWLQLRAAVSVAPAGEVAALPWGTYRRLDWDGNRVVLDPLPRLLDRRVLTDDDLPLSAVTVRGEDARSAAISAGIAAGQRLPDLLRANGIRYAVVHRTQPDSAATERALAGLPVLYRSPDLLLVELPGEVEPTPENEPWRAILGLGVAGLATGAVIVSRASRLLGSPAAND
ncbi:MAG TPA: hypothetical protein VGP36_03405 [Mycobacteriales bacterium]|jgi:hypothetical protein|nr:hypothetical protein [Mycobacteriales bacterium]